MHPEKKPALETPSTATTRLQRGELLSPEQPQGAFWRDQKGGRMGRPGRTVSRLGIWWRLNGIYRDFNGI